MKPTGRFNDSDSGELINNLEQIEPEESLKEEIETPIAEKKKAEDCVDSFANVSQFGDFEIDDWDELGHLRRSWPGRDRYRPDMFSYRNH